MDPETNEVMTEFEGRAVEPAAFPYRVVEYVFSSDETRAEIPTVRTDPAPARGGSVTATVTVGAGASKMSLTGASVAVSRGRRFANDRVFSVPAFLDVETGRRPPRGVRVVRLFPNRIRRSAVAPSRGSKLEERRRTRRPEDVDVRVDAVRGVRAFR